jgi:hypothetical protein
VTSARRRPHDDVGHPDRVAIVAAVAAGVLGTASAAVSAYWALGGTELLDTVGGSIEEWGRDRRG